MSVRTDVDSWAAGGDLVIALPGALDWAVAVTDLGFGTTMILTSVRWTPMWFEDRSDAGRQLAQALAPMTRPGLVVAGMARGGVPVAAEVARALGVRLDVIVVRKLGVPFHRELAMGAIGEHGVRVIDDDVIGREQVSRGDVEAIDQAERAELLRLVHRFRVGHPAIPLVGRSVIVIDDGVATGSTALAACHVARIRGAQRVVLAVPVGPAPLPDTLRLAADEIVCLHASVDFRAVGCYYRDFTQVSDEQVADLLTQSVA